MSPMWSGWWWVCGSLWHQDMVSPRGNISLNSACWGLPGLTLVSPRNTEPAYRVADQSGWRSQSPSMLVKSKPVSPGAELRYLLRWA